MEIDELDDQNLKKSPAGESSGTMTEIAYIGNNLQLQNHSVSVLVKKTHLL